MLQRLELADWLAELLAVARIFDGGGEQFVERAHRFGADRGQTEVEHVGKRGLAVGGRIEQRAGGHEYLV